MTSHNIRCRSAVIFVLAVLFFCEEASLLAQSADSVKVGGHVISAAFADETTNDPINGVTFYVVAKTDTLVAGFGFSDSSGRVSVENLHSGEYAVRAEMLGYLEFRQDVSIVGDLDLGIIELKESQETIEPSTITAYAKLVSIEKDTLVYNASAYRIMENAVLEDLLNRLPGMTIRDDGVILANGKPVDKITIDGKTYFFNDPALVLKNMPATVIERIKVYDEPKADKKVMDIQLKEEYKDGWFGRFSASGGLSLHSKGDTEKNIPLYSGDFYASCGREEDQLTLVAMGSNSDRENRHRAMVNDEFNQKQGGLAQSMTVGANYNTERIRGLETNASVSFSRDTKKITETRDALLFNGQDQQVRTNNVYQGFGADNTVSANVYLKNKEQSKIAFELIPTLSYSKSSRSTEGISTATLDDVLTDNSISSTSADNNIVLFDMEHSFAIRNVGGKSGRTFLWTGEYGCSFLNGNEMENSEDLKLSFRNTSRTLDLINDFTFAEPFNDKWSVRASCTIGYSSQYEDKAASDSDTGFSNPNHSSEMSHSSLSFAERIYAQYDCGNIRISAGPNLEQERIRGGSSSLGKECNSSDWQYNWSPFIALKGQKERLSYSIEYVAKMTPFSPELVSPSLDITDPMRVQIGNVYLKPFCCHSLLPHLTYYNAKGSSYLWFSPSFILLAHPVTNASWFDEKGIQYSIPVNSDEPGINAGASLNYSAMLGKQMNWSIGVNYRFSYSMTNSFQPQSSIDGIDINNYDYSSIMAGLWGGSYGELFYSGGSGFAKSKCVNFTNSLQCKVGYKRQSYSIAAGCDIDNSSCRYSQNPLANTDWWEFDINGRFVWTGKRGFQIDTKCSYVCYSGISREYARPECLIDFKLSQDIKKVSLILCVNDLLNQHRLYQRTASSQGVVNVTTNALGRNILLGIAFHFGRPREKAGAIARTAVDRIAR